MLYKPVEYMKKYIVCVTVVMLIMLCGCNKQKANAAYGSIRIWL